MCNLYLTKSDEYIHGSLKSLDLQMASVKKLVASITAAMLRSAILMFPCILSNQCRRRSVADKYSNISLGMFGKIVETTQYTPKEVLGHLIEKVGALVQKYMKKYLN